MTLIGGRYQKQVLIGKGGMGTVYRGLDTRTNTTVAIKSPLPAMIDLDMMDRFEREADALRRLDHPNIVRVMDTVKEGDGFHIIMEYVDGGDLSHLIEEGRVSVNRPS
ncbi:MAG: protein kinase, partial [Chloroflexota bacterium]